MNQPLEIPLTDPAVALLAKRIAEENALNLRTDAGCAEELALAVSVACASVRAAMAEELDAPFVPERASPVTQLPPRTYATASAVAAFLPNIRPTERASLSRYK